MITVHWKAKIIPLDALQGVYFYAGNDGFQWSPRVSY